MIIKIHGITHSGRVRSSNEDYFIINQKKSLFLLADGMGGHNAGEVASKGACKAFEKYFVKNAKNIKLHMNEVFAKTNRAIITQGKYQPELKNMGATFIVCHIRNEYAHIVHTGDVRAYHLHNDKLIQVTRDHNLVSELLKQGYISKQEAEKHPMRSRVTKAIGIKDKVNPDYNKVKLLNNDLILMCCDGLWNMVNDKKIQAILITDKTIEKKVKELVAEANKAGGKDNITAIIIHFQSK